MNTEYIVLHVYLRYEIMFQQYHLIWIYLSSILQELALGSLNLLGQYDINDLYWARLICEILLYTNFHMLLQCIMLHKINNIFNMSVFILCVYFIIFLMKFFFIYIYILEYYIFYSLFEKKNKYFPIILQITSLCAQNTDPNIRKMNLIKLEFLRNLILDYYMFLILITIFQNSPSTLAYALT